MISSTLLFLFDCIYYSYLRSMSVVLIDGLSFFSSVLVFYEIVLLFIAFTIIAISLGNRKRPELVLIQLANLIGIILLISSND
jgi:hypothetical protein